MEAKLDLELENATNTVLNGNCVLCKNDISNQKTQIQLVRNSDSIGFATQQLQLPLQAAHLLAMIRRSNKAISERENSRRHSSGIMM